MKETWTRTEVIRLVAITAFVVAFAMVLVNIVFDDAAHGTTGDTVADWRMEEARKATVMVDSANNHDGRIGWRVRLTGHAYIFPGETRKTAGAHGAYQPSRLVRVPESNALDPRGGAFAVKVRFKMLDRGPHKPNLIQKGQSNQAGGYWKLAINTGWPRCHFRDADGNTAAVGFVHGLDKYKVTDGDWHTVTCQRLTDGRTSVTLDGTTRTWPNTTGNLNNTRPLVMGGKLDCASDRTGCDYINAKIAWVTITH